MNTLHRHLLLQVVTTLAMTLAVFTFVLLLGSVLKEVLTLLVSQNAPPRLLLQAIALLVPYLLVYALPMALLATTLLVFGRLSADQELTAVRASGISLLALAAPILLFSVLLSLICGAVNLHIAPASRVAYKNLLFQFLLDRPMTPFVSGRFVTEFPNIAVYVGTVRGDTLEDVLFYELQDDVIVRDLRAPSARFTLDTAERKIRLHFPSATVLYWVARSENTSAPDPVISPGGSAASAPATSDRQGFWLPVAAADVTTEFSYDEAAQNFRRPKYSELTFWQLWLEKQSLTRQGIPNINPVAVQLHKQLSMSFACIGFCLIGIPLGVRAHRRETTAGIGIALALALSYYGFIILGEALATKPGRLPLLILWLPNFLFQLLGGFLLWRTNRGA